MVSSSMMNVMTITQLPMMDAVPFVRLKVDGPVWVAALPAKARATIYCQQLQSFSLMAM